MWMHRSGELHKDRPIVTYEYQKGRVHHIPLEFYKDYKSVVVTDGLSQYHLVDKKLPDITNANCWAHARRDYADAIKAAEKSNPEAQNNYQAPERIAKFYKKDSKLKDLPSKERLQKRRLFIKPLVEDYFAWGREILADSTVLPKGKTADGLKYSLNQKYLKVFLDNPDVFIDNSRLFQVLCKLKKLI